MRIHDRILFGFVCIGVAIGVVGYLSLTLSQGAFENTIGRQSVSLAQTTMSYIMDSIQQYLDDTRHHAQILAGSDRINASNAAFEQDADRDGTIQRMEDLWREGTASEIESITDNEVSQYLRDNLECRDYYLRTCGYFLFGEVFATNQYGVNVAQTRKTSDYYQADENWWQRAKTYGTYIGPIQYDQSAEMYEVDLAVRFDDRHGQFVGVLKSVLNLRRVTAILAGVKARSEYASTRVRLICDNNVIYDTQSPALEVTPLEAPVLAKIQACRIAEGTMEIQKPAGAAKLAAFYRVGHSDVPEAFNAVLLLEYDKAEVLSPIARLRKRMVYLTVILIIGSSIGGWLLAGSISRPLARLNDMAVEISRGNLEVHSQIRSSGEIRQLADTFDLMAHELRDTLNHLRSEIKVRQQAETALAASNQDLQEAIHKMDLVNQELRHFVYIASHDLREPLRKITSFGGLLKQSLSGHLNEDDQENMDFMIDGADRMTRLIDDLLVYSRVGRKEEPFVEVDLNDVVQHLREFELSRLIEETGTRIEVPDPLPVVHADPVQVSQLIQNLMANGIKFHRQDVSPVITIRGLSWDDHSVRIEVQDNGIGIKPEYHKDVFVMFKRLHSRAQYEGTGIGLAICKKIVERHGGRIEVEPAPDQGSIFWFTLPIAEEVEAVSSTKVLA